MIYTAPYIMFLMRADPLRGQVGEGWALGIDTFLGPVKWHRAVTLLHAVTLISAPQTGCR
jgi:hypothetical protein